MATQTQFESAVAEALGTSRKHVQEVLDAVAGIASETLKDSGSVRLRNLCTIKIVDKPATEARMGRHPGTGEMVEFAAKPASQKLRLSPSKVLRDNVGI